MPKILADEDGTLTLTCPVFSVIKNERENKEFEYKEYGHGLLSHSAEWIILTV